MSSILGLWMNGEFVGRWRRERSGSTLTYASSWIESEKSRSLSLSLPITSAREIRGQVVTDFFDNLLPDDPRIRERLGRRFRTKDAETFTLLEAIGRDCIGAVQLLPDGAEPIGWNRVDVEPLTRQQVGRVLRAIPSASLAGFGDEDDDDLFRISLAGAQEKTALTKVGRRWCLPRGATPTTHIFKLPLGLAGGSRRIDLSDSVENEWLCAQLLHELGLPVAHTEMAEFEGQKVLIVERFDRRWMDDRSWIVRLPQEDFCQALGIAGAKKYERDGGPGMEDCLRLLAGSAEALDDRIAFQLAQVAFWLMAATDGHAKNYSIFLGHGDIYSMTPLYDVMSLWPTIGDEANEVRWRSAKLAMAVRTTNAHYALHSLQARHWRALALKNGGPAVWNAMCALVQRVESTLDRVEARMPEAFPIRVWHAVSAGMRAQAELFLAGASTLAAPT